MVEKQGKNRTVRRQTQPIIEIDGEQFKVCRGCGELKPLTAYYRHKNKPDGRQSKCKQCMKEQSSDELINIKMPDPNRHPLNLTVERVREIRRMYAKREYDKRVGIRTIADHFQLPWVVVHDLVKYLTYRDVE